MREGWCAESMSGCPSPVSVCMCLCTCGHEAEPVHACESRRALSRTMLHHPPTPPLPANESPIEAAHPSGPQTHSHPHPHPSLTLNFPSWTSCIASRTMACVACSLRDSRTTASMKRRLPARAEGMQARAHCVDSSACGNASTCAFQHVRARISVSIPAHAGTNPGAHPSVCRNRHTGCARMTCALQGAVN